MNRLPQRLAIPKDGNLEGVFKRLAPELLRSCGYEVDVLVKRVRKKRSGQQNRAVRGYWMSIIMEEEYGLPYTKEEEQRVYDEIKIEMDWTVEKINRRTGEVRKFPRDTHTLDAAVYSNWMEMFARHISMNHGINLPPPERLKAII